MDGGPLFSQWRFAHVQDTCTESMTSRKKERCWLYIYKIVFSNSLIVSISILRDRETLKVLSYLSSSDAHFFQDAATIN